MKRIENGKGGKYMKKLFYICCLFTVCLLHSCDKEEFGQTLISPKSLKDYKYVFQITSAESNMTTRAFSNKSDWQINDEIYFFIEGDKNEVCRITYKGEGEWILNEIKTMAPFANKQGKLVAVYSPNIVYTDVLVKDDVLFTEDGTLLVEGDVLFTEDGTYKKEDDVICITLNMNKRPLNRIIIEGVDDGTSIESFTTPYALTSLNPIIWSTMINGVPYEYDNSSRTAVYYGMIDSYDDATTIIRLRDKDGCIYERTYNKTPILGESIIINGPLSFQSDLWEKKVLVDDITLNANTLNLSIGDTYSLQASLKNPNATNTNLIWSSSNPNVATVNENGVITAIQRGNATIIVGAEDGSVEVSCNVIVANVEDFIDIGYNLRSMSNGGGIQISFSLPIKNDYIKDIKIVNGLRFGSNSVAVISSLSKFEASLGKNEIAPQEVSNCMVNLNFSGYFSFKTGSWAGNQNYLEIDFMVEGKIYTIRKYLPWNLD